MLRKILTQVSNFDDLMERLLTRLSSNQKADFQERVNLLFPEPETAPEEEDDILDEEFIRKCEQILIDIIGPIAPILIQEVLSSGSQNCTMFVEALAAKIDVPQLSLEFERRAFMED